MRNNLIIFCLFVSLVVSAADEASVELAPVVADLVVQGNFKEAMVATSNTALKETLNKLINMNKLVSKTYESEIGKEISIHIRRKLQKGILTKIKGTTLYVKVQKGSITATWPVKVKTLPFEFRMERAGVTDLEKNLYLAVKAFRQKNYSAAAYYFEHSGPISKSLFAAADRKSKYVISLTTACVKGDLEKTKELLKKGADVNGSILAHLKNKKTGLLEKKGSTILIESIKHRKSEIVKYLIKNGAKINKPNSSGVTPLMFAIISFPKSTELVEFMLNHQANYKLKDKAGNTALTGAIGVGRGEAVKILIKHGADINGRNKKGYTPLMLAVASNNINMFKLLLEKGADIKKRHLRGWTVLDMDRRRMHPEIKAVLDKISPPRKPKAPDFSGLSNGGVNVIPQRR